MTSRETTLGSTARLSRLGMLVPMVSMTLRGGVRSSRAADTGLLVGDLSFGSSNLGFP